MGGRDDTIGYKRPPTAHRFKKGKSGNPRGRPRKGEALAVHPLDADSVVLREGRRVVPLRDANGKAIELTALEASMRALFAKAMKGDVRAIEVYLRQVFESEDRLTRSREQAFRDAVENLENWREAIERAERLGLPPPPIFPHPDDVAIDWRNGSMRINGPADEAEAAEWASMQEIKQRMLEEIGECRGQLKEYAGDEKITKYIMNDLSYAKWQVSYIDCMYPEEAVRRRPGFDLQKWRVSKAPEPWEPNVRRAG